MMYDQTPWNATREHVFIVVQMFILHSAGHVIKCDVMVHYVFYNFLYVFPCVMYTNVSSREYCFSKVFKIEFN